MYLLIKKEYTGIFYLGTEKMFADAGDDRTAADPAVGGLIGVIIVESTAGGVGAGERFACGTFGGIGDSGVDLSVRDGGESAWLINNAGNTVGEGGGLHAVEDDRTDSDLTDIRFAAGFSRNNACKKLDVGIGHRRSGRTGEAGR